MTTPAFPLTPNMGPVAWVRDAQGNPVPLTRSDAGQLSNGQSHVRMVRDEREGGNGSRRPRVPDRKSVV